MSPNLLIASQLSQHVTPVVPDVVDDLVDDLVDYAASNICVSTNTAVPLMDERERYIDQLLAEIESLQVRLFPFIPFSRIRLFISFQLCKMSRLVESVCLTRNTGTLWKHLCHNEILVCNKSLCNVLVTRDIIVTIHDT